VAPSLWLRGPVVSLRLRAVPPPKIKSGCRSISLQNRMAAAELGRGAYGTVVSRVKRSFSVISQTRATLSTFHGGA
jgi:hypothetical protein